MGQSGKTLDHIHSDDPIRSYGNICEAILDSNIRSKMSTCLLLKPVGTLSIKKDDPIKQEIEVKQLNSH